MFELAPRSDLQMLQQRFALNGFVHVPDFLASNAAEELHRVLRSRDDWKQVITRPDGYIELDRKTRAVLNPDQAAALDTAVYAQARTGFQYRYESIRVPDGAAERAASTDILARLAEWMSSGATREFLRELTGFPDIAFADAQATAFSPGDFLTGHDDQIEGKHRRAAYVLNLTPVWRVEWGGLLLFHEEGPAVRGLAPSFNALNIFSVPAMHSVSEVTRASPYRRYSITGWLRSLPQP